MLWFFFTLLYFISLWLFSSKYRQETHMIAALQGFTKQSNCLMKNENTSIFQFTKFDCFFFRKKTEKKISRGIDTNPLYGASTDPPWVMIWLKWFNPCSTMHHNSSLKRSIRRVPHCFHTIFLPVFSTFYLRSGNVPTKSQHFTRRTSQHYSAKLNLLE